MHRIFVYGTIKVGQPNHDFLHSAGPNKHNFVGTGQTESQWRLVIENKYNWPYLLDCEGEGNNVRGEIYEVDDELFKELDKAELHEECYIRKKIHVRMDNTPVSDPETTGDTIEGGSVGSRHGHGSKDETTESGSGCGANYESSQSGSESTREGSGGTDIESNHVVKDETGSEFTGRGSGETESESNHEAEYETGSDKESKEGNIDPGLGPADESNMLECWAYMFHKFIPRMRSLTTFEAYDNDGDHGKQLAPVYDKENAVWTVPFDDLHKEVCNWHLDLDDEEENETS